MGYTNDFEKRKNATSGGLLTEVTNYLLESGDIDIVIDRTWRGYRIRDKVEMEQQSAVYIEGSYYHILTELKSYSNKRIAVIGLPCTVGALRKIIEPKNKLEFTFSLFCGHLKKNSFLTELLKEVESKQDLSKNINFRTKLHKSESASDYYFTESDNPKTFRMKTSFLGEWGSGPHRMPMCDLCMDSFGEEADASFGDAWHHPHEADKWGTSIVILRNDRIRKILDTLKENKEITLQDGDVGDIMKSQKSGIENKTVGSLQRWQNLMEVEGKFSICTKGWWKNKYLFRVFLNKNEGKKIYKILLFFYFCKFVSLRSFIRRVVG